MSVTSLGYPYTPFAQPVSVLAPRCVNVPSKFMSARKTSPKLEDVTPFSQRRIKQAPVLSHAHLHEARRQNVAANTRARRDDRQFERRADDIMRSSFLQQQKHREALLEQEATQHTQPEDEEQAIEAESNTQTEEAPDEQEILEEQEMRELESLLELMPITSDADLMEVAFQEHSEHYGSDGEDIEHLMHQILEDYDGGGLDDAMDLS